MEQRIIPIRASSFGGFFDCAMRFEWEQLMGKQRASSLRAHLGTSIHAATAAFDQAKLDGQGVNVMEAGQVLIDTFDHPEREVDYRDDRLTKNDAKSIGMKLLSAYCGQIAPRMQYESVEMPLEPLDVDCGAGLIVRLTGTMDRARVAKFVRSPIVKVGDNFSRTEYAEAHTIITDLKTGGRLISDGQVIIKGRAPQTGIYQILYEHTTGRQTGGSQIAALQTTALAPVGVSQVFDAKRIMLGTENHTGLLELAAEQLKAGRFLPNPQSALCSEKFCGRWASCPYHE